MRPPYRYRITNADVYPTPGLMPPPDAHHHKTGLHKEHHNTWNRLGHKEKAQVFVETVITRGYRIRYEDTIEPLRRHRFGDVLLALDEQRGIYIHHDPRG